MVVEEVLDERSIKVIHYTGNPDGAADSSCSTSGTFLSSSGSGCGRKGKVIREVLTFPPGCEIMLEVLTYPESRKLSEDPVSRALKRENEEKYALLTNNCECLANWACIGEGVSIQGERCQNTAIGLTTGALAGGALGTAAGYLAVKCMEKNGKKLDPSTKLMIEIGAAIGGAFVGGVVGYKAAGYYTDSQMADR